LLEFSEKVTRKIDLIKEKYELFNKIISKLQTADNFDVAESIAALESLQRSLAVPFINGRVEKILPVLYSLQNAEKQIASSKKMLNEMRFSESVAAASVSFENKIRLAGVDRRFALLKKEGGNLKRAAADLQILYGSLARQNILPEKSIPSLEAFLNRKNMSDVFACDTLQLAPAAKVRSRGVGQYDSYVGIEYLYGTLVMFRSGDTVRSRYVIPFEPLLERAVFHLGLIAYFKEYVANNCRSYMAPGKLGDYMKFLDTQLHLRDRIVKDMQQRLRSVRKSSREYFIAHGIAYAFAPHKYSFEQRKKIAGEFAAFRVRMQNLNRQYNSALPEEAIKIRDQILKEGIPGDPAVKRMWSLR
ncbi:MAG: hypothetical protein J6S54_00170, partial [Lentisphaeria bacterium]|nr:hypothetical protein [Lentisphaeria bacterium]